MLSRFAEITPECCLDRLQNFSRTFSRNRPIQPHLSSRYRTLLVQQCSFRGCLGATGLVAMQEVVGSSPIIRFVWHHLHRLRRNSTPGQTSHGPTHSAKQEITETIKFLTWLHETHHRTAATCRQQDIDEWLPPDRQPAPRSARSSCGPTRAKSTPRCTSTPHRPTAPACSPKTSDWHGSKDSSPTTSNHCPTGRWHTAAALRPTPDQNRRPAHSGDRCRPPRDAHIAWG